MKFDSSTSLANNHVKYTLHIVTLGLRGSKYSRQTFNSGLIFLRDSWANNIMINHKAYKSWLIQTSG